MTPDHQGYLMTFALTSVYAIVLALLDRAYEPDWTILTVVGGVALVGVGVAYRLTLGAPAGTPDAVAWWAWLQVAWHFVVSAVPIALWQIWQARRRIRNLIAYLREGRNRDNPPDRAA